MSSTDVIAQGVPEILDLAGGDRPPLSDFIEIGASKNGLKIPLPLGIDSNGERRFLDLAGGHLLISGQTGSGKSVFLQSLISSIVSSCSLQEARCLILDCKGLDLVTTFANLSHNLVPPVSDVTPAIVAIHLAAREMEKRRKILREARCRDIWEIQEQIREDFPTLVLVIDEVQVLAQGSSGSSSKSAIDDLILISQQGRASGVLLVLATQRPTRNVLHSDIKANLSQRVCFRVSSQSDSRVALDQNGAEKLAPGELLVVSPTLFHPVKITVPFVSRTAIEEVLEPIRHPRSLNIEPPALEQVARKELEANENDEHAEVQSIPSDAICTSTADPTSAPSLATPYGPGRPEEEIATLGFPLDTSEHCHLSGFASIRLDITQLRKHIGEEEELELIYRPSLMLEMTHRWRSRRRIFDTLTGCLYSRKRAAVPFLEPISQFDEKTHVVLEIAASGIVSTEDPPEDVWKLVELGMVERTPRGWRISDKLRNGPSLDPKSLNPHPAEGGRILEFSAKAALIFERNARREVARIFKDRGSTNARLIGLPCWRWTQHNNQIIDMPAWPKRRHRWEPWDFGGFVPINKACTS